MSVFSSPSFDNHELVSFTEHAESGLRAIIAVHNTNLGAAVGGLRMFPYADDHAALEDVLRLSRGMTYKSALAGLPMGGGKAVIIGDHREIKTPALLHAMGDFIESQGGRYITAEDSGTTVADMEQIGQRTKYVSGMESTQSFGGDPSPYTAYGVFCGIEAALQHRRGDKSLKKVRVAVQGAGAVGRYLVKRLLDAGATVSVADINRENLDQVIALGANAVSVDEIMTLEADVFSPCAMGAVLNERSIVNLKASIVAGGANNQLAATEHGDLLREKEILYAPDFVINAGGIIDIHHQRADSPNLSDAHIARIGDTLSTIFAQSDVQNESTVAVAERLAEDVFMNSAKRLSNMYSKSNAA